MSSITGDAFVGRRHSIQRALVCAMAGHFPVLIRTGDAALACVFRTGAPHYGRSATLAIARSLDGGQRWSAPVEVAARGDDIRNPAFGIVGDRWILGYWKAAWCYPDGRWRAPAAEPPEPDAFVITSDDHGASWSAPRPQRSELLAWASPFGRIVASPDGSLLMPMYGIPRDGGERRYDAIVRRSHDGGLSWGDESLVARSCSELSLCWDGARLLGAVRHAEGHTVLVTSDDGGRAWSAPVAVTRGLEHPADLCRLASGRLLLSFGRRRRPLGCGALLSDDGGASWTLEAMLAGDGIGNDVGYPSTVQLADGAIVTALYFARGSAASEPLESWGEVSCQALRYDETIFAA